MEREEMGKEKQKRSAPADFITQTLTQAAIAQNVNVICISR